MLIVKVLYNGYSEFFTYTGGYFSDIEDEIYRHKKNFDKTKTLPECEDNFFDYLNYQEDFCMIDTEYDIQVEVHDDPKY
jgi:hypothetical protein